MWTVAFYPETEEWAAINVDSQVWRFVETERPTLAAAVLLADRLNKDKTNLYRRIGETLGG